MRTARHIILANNTLGRTGLDDRRLKRPYSRLRKICESLSEDGFDYTVEMSSHWDGRIRFEVTGTAAARG